MIEPIRPPARWTLAVLVFAVVVAGCQGSVDLAVGNPCSHPLFVTLGSITGQVGGAAVAPGATTMIGGIAEGGSQYELQVDPVGYQRPVTFDEADAANGTVWLDRDACLSADISLAPTIVVVRVGGGVRFPLFAGHVGYAAWSVVC